MVTSVAVVAAMVADVIVTELWVWLVTVTSVAVVSVAVMDVWVIELWV